MAKIILLVALIAVVYAASIEQQFNEYMIKYNKRYETASEYYTRLQNFQENLIRANELQAENPLAKFGITKFSDLSIEEYKNMVNVNVPKSTPLGSRSFDNEAYSLTPSSPNPDTWNWCSEGACTAINNQGQCGSDWGFALVETVESYFFLTGHPLAQLSVDQVVYCSSGDEGCDGSWITDGYSYIQECGIEYASESEGEGCFYKQQDVATGVPDYVNITHGENGLYKQLSTAGPATVCVDASTWVYYQGGILTSCTNQIDTCVVLTGYADYGSANAYWIVRNSWGSDWGENGFIWIAIGKDLCGIGEMGQYPVLGPPPAHPPASCSN